MSMAIPLKYNLRSLWVRRVSTGMTLAGIALAVAVFIGVMALAKGLETAFTATGEAMNLVVLRQGSQAEVVSSISREALQPLSYLEGVATDARGRPLVSPEVIVVVNLPRQGSDNRSNVLIRGLSPQGFALQPSVRLMAGRALQPGLRELVVSRAAAQRFQGLELGARVKLGRGEWSVVGHFEAHQTAFDSEVWADVYELAEEFDRQEYSSVLLKAVDDAAQAALIHRISEDQRLHLKALREEAYYAEQTTTAAPVKALGFFLAVLMAIGTAFAAMNTMYAAVAHRTREIATLRVLGFRPRNILLSFLIESLILSLSGGGLGCLLALPIHGTSTGTTNFQTFSEIAFAFRVTPDLLLRGLLFALLIGFLGGALPARLAARQLIARAFRGT
jgi:putative ABC transport system permease protein